MANSATFATAWLGAKAVLFGMAMLFLAIACTTTPPDALQSDPDPIATLPLRLDYSNRPVVPVKVNGEGPFDFLIDSASTTTAIFRNLERRLETAPVGRDARVFSLDEISSQPVVALKSITVDTITDVQPEVIIFDDWRNLDRTPHGILGLDFLSDYFVVIDLPGGSVKFYDPKNKPSSITSTWPNAALQQEQFGLDGPPLFILQTRVIFSGRFPMLLDTGAELSLGNFPLMNSLRTLPSVARRDRRTEQLAGATDGEVDSFLLRTPSVATGDIRWRNQQFLISRARIFSDLGYEEQPLAILGFDAIKTRAIAIDFEGLTLYADKQSTDDQLEKSQNNTTQKE